MGLSNILEDFQFDFQIKMNNNFKMHHFKGLILFNL